MNQLIILVIFYNLYLSINGQQPTYQLQGQAVPNSPEAAASSALTAQLSEARLKAIEQAKLQALQRARQLSQQQAELSIQPGAQTSDLVKAQLRATEQAKLQALQQAQQLGKLEAQKKAELQAQQQTQQLTEAQEIAQQIAQLQAQQQGQLPTPQQQAQIQSQVLNQGKEKYNGIDLDKLTRFRDEIIKLAQARKVMENQRNQGNWYAQSIAQAQARKFYRDQARQRAYEQLRNQAQAEASIKSYDDPNSQAKFDALQKAYQQEQIQRAQDNAQYQAQIQAIQKEHQKQITEHQQQNQAYVQQVNPLIIPINNLLNNLYSGLNQLKSEPNVLVEPMPWEVQQMLRDSTPNIETKVDLDKLQEIQKMFFQLSNAKVSGYTENPMLTPLNTMLNSVDSILEQLLTVLNKAPAQPQIDQALLAQ